MLNYNIDLIIKPKKLSERETTQYIHIWIAIGISHYKPTTSSGIYFSIIAIALSVCTIASHTFKKRILNKSKHDLYSYI